MAMTGREISDKKIKNRCFIYLESLPSFVKGYYNYMSGKSESSKVQYLCNLKKFLEYIKGDENVKDMTLEEILSIKTSTLRNYFYGYLPEEQGISKMTCTVYYSALKCFYEYLMKDLNCLKSNPLDNVQRPVDDKDRQPVSLTKDQVEDLISCIENEPYKHKNVELYKAYCSRDKAMIYLGITTGMRVGTVSQLNIEDVDLENGVITVVTKGGKEQSFGICKAEKRFLEEWLSRRDKISRPNETALFVGQSGVRLEPGCINKIVHKYSGMIGKPISFHKLRSTCATLLYEKTRDVYQVSNMLGHRNVTTTQRYINRNSQTKINDASTMGDMFNI